MVGGVSGAGPQQIQFGAVGKGAEPDLSGLGDEQALALLLVQRGYLVQQFISGSEKDRALLNDKIDKVRNALDELNAAGDDPQTALKNRLQGYASENAQDYNFQQPFMDPDDLVGVPMSSYEATVDTGSYPGLSPDIAPAVALKTKDGKMHMVRYSRWKEMTAAIEKKKLAASDDADFTIDGRKLLFTVDETENKARILYYKTKYESVVNDPKEQKLTKLNYFSPKLMSPEAIATIKSLGLNFPQGKGGKLVSAFNYFGVPAATKNVANVVRGLGEDFPDSTSNREDWRKLITSVQGKLSQFNQDIQDLSRKVTENTHYMQQYQEMGSTITANHSRLIGAIIRNIVLN